METGTLTTRTGNRGLALLLVLIVILALGLIATPFVLSMISQERTATTSRYLSQADYAADGARNYALWRLSEGIDPLERKSSTPPFSSYFFDTPLELDPGLDRLQKKLSKGAIWGVSVQDEQGKLNVRTCPGRVLENLGRRVDGRIVNLKDYLTLYSGRDAVWIHPQRLRRKGFQRGEPGDGVGVDNWRVLGPGARVRVAKPGTSALETWVRANRDCGLKSLHDFIADHPLDPYFDGTIEIEARHPVNINTAKWETLAAMFEGLRLHENGQSLVDRRAAELLASAVEGREVRRIEDFFDIVRSVPLRMDQRLAVFINAVCPTAAILGGSGTVPVCFKSYDVYTLEAASSVNSPAGAQVAGRGYREVVSVSPPIPLLRSCESQHDFSQMLSQLETALQRDYPPLAVSGYPFGSDRMVTFPKHRTRPCDVVLKNEQQPGLVEILSRDRYGEALVTLRPAEDHRGRSAYEEDLTHWPDRPARDHFKFEMDGKPVGAPIKHPWTQFFTEIQDSEDDELQPGQKRPDTGSGGCEFWVNMMRVQGSIGFFAIMEEETTNRVSLLWDKEERQLILTVADGTLPHKGGEGDHIANGVAEIVWPEFDVQVDQWTHLSANWKSNRFADLALLVDGFADPKQRFIHATKRGGDELITVLNKALTPTSLSIPLGRTGFLPRESTPLLIGGEVVLIDGATQSVVRGARNTTPADHPAQATVTLFGYSSKLRTGRVVADFPEQNFQVTLDYDRLPRTASTLAFGFGARPEATVAENPQIDAAQSRIAVLSPDIMDYPEQGYLRIDQEVIFYTGRATEPVPGTIATGSFTGCVRGQFRTTAAPHGFGVKVQLWSIAAGVDRRMPSPAILQIGDEWFGPVQRDPTNRNFWVGFIAPGNLPVDFRRGNDCFGSTEQRHEAGDALVPTFLAQDINSWPCNGHSLGAGDRVTLTDQHNRKATARIRRANPPPPPPDKPPTWPGRFSIENATQIAALWEPVDRDWVPDDQHVRVLKFPSGELLSLAWLRKDDPKFVLSPIPSFIDEFKAFAGPKGRIRMEQVADPGDATFKLSAPQISCSRGGGLLKVGNEYVGYGSWSAGSITQLQRGWLNSAEGVHDRGDPVFYLPWIPVASLEKGLSDVDSTLRLTQALSGDPENYTQGYALVDDEMILFQWNNKDEPERAGRILTMPVRKDGVWGLYRGMFGTEPAAHSSDRALVYGMPFRYWDTYKPGEFDNTMSYFQWSTKLDLARWRSYRWVHENPFNSQLDRLDPNIIVHALARLDGRGEFWDRPGMDGRVLLLESTAAGTNVRIDRTGYLQDAGQLDIRFYVEYRRGSFDARMPREAQSWKRRPKIKELHVDYERPTQTLHHEDR